MNDELLEKKTQLFFKIINNYSEYINNGTEEQKKLCNKIYNQVKNSDNNCKNCNNTQNGHNLFHNNKNSYNVSFGGHQTQTQTQTMHIGNRLF